MQISMIHWENGQQKICNIIEINSEIENLNYEFISKIVAKC